MALQQGESIIPLLFATQGFGFDDQSLAVLLAGQKDALVLGLQHFVLRVLGTGVVDDAGGPGIVMLCQCVADVLFRVAEGGAAA